MSRHAVDLPINNPSIITIMKHYLCLPLFLFLSAALFSAPNGKGEKKRPGLPSREALIKKFDADGDGKLSDEERENARKQMPGKGRKLPPEVLQKFDKDGDGELNGEERAAAREQFEKRKAEALEKFDADGDGKLSLTERRKAMESFRKEVQDEEEAAGKENAGKGKEGKEGKPDKKKGDKKKGGKSGKKGQGKKPKKKKKDS